VQDIVVAIFAGQGEAVRTPYYQLPSARQGGYCGRRCVAAVSATSAYDARLEQQGSRG
jgi:hypothetical protein